MGNEALPQYRFFDRTTLPIFAAAAACIVPTEPHSPGADDPRCLLVADGMIAERPAADQQLLRAFLRALQLLAVLRHGRAFTALSPARRLSLLRALERNRLLPRLRAGVFGLKNFALLGYYGSELCFGELGYPGPRMDAPYYTLRKAADP